MRQKKVDRKDALGCTALFEAVSDDNFQEVKSLLEAGANPNISENNGTTPLMEASSGNNGKIVKLLLAHGANPNLNDNFGDDAASYARSQKHTNLAAFLESASIANLKS